MIPNNLERPNEQSSDTLYAKIKCPLCGFEAYIHKDQYEGRVSIQCNLPCTYHEVHDLRIFKPSPEVS